METNVEDSLLVKLQLLTVSKVNCKVQLLKYFVSSVESSEFRVCFIRVKMRMSLQLANVVEVEIQTTKIRPLI